MNILNGENKYKDLLFIIKEQIRSSQIKAAISVNTALIRLYWDIGKSIAENQVIFEGRNNYIDRLAKYILANFPGLKGFSRRNLFEIRRFYLFYYSVSVQQVAALKYSPKIINSGTLNKTEKLPL